MRTGNNIPCRLLNKSLVEPRNRGTVSKGGLHFVHKVDLARRKLLPSGSAGWYKYQGEQSSLTRKPLEGGTHGMTEALLLLSIGSLLTICVATLIIAILALRHAQRYVQL